MKNVFSVAVALVAFAVSGCGGSGSSVSVPSPFLGSYSGNWDSESLGLDGTCTFQIASNGAMTGTSRVNSTGETATIKASVNAGGLVNGTLKFPDEAPYSMKGSLIKDSQGNLTGTLIPNIDGVNHPIDLVVQSAG